MLMKTPDDDHPDKSKATDKEKTGGATVKGAREAPKAVQSRMETLIITVKMVNEWRIPPFQRPLRINEKVRTVSEQIKQTECIEGIITLGKIKNDPDLYVVDGQHRLEAFKISMLDEAIVDVRVVIFDNMSEMADEFSRQNTSLVKMRPDDILRGLEFSTPALRAIRTHCDFVGYDQIRRSGASPILSMSALLRCFNASRYETPSTSAAGLSAPQMAQHLDNQAVETITSFLNIAHAAWGRDPEYYRLWGNLNLSMCMWLYHKLVLDRDRRGGRRYVILNAQQFKQCLMSVSADSDYLSWLQGRNLGERDRSPAFNRLRTLFIKRLSADSPNVKPMFPQPAWATSARVAVG